MIFAIKRTKNILKLDKAVLFAIMKAYTGASIKLTNENRKPGFWLFRSNQPNIHMWVIPRKTKERIWLMATVNNLLLQKGKDVWSVQVTSTIRETLKLMGEKNIGAVLVMDGQKIEGIFSERDYARHAARRNAMLLDEHVRDFMTDAVYYVSPHETVEEVMALMTSKKIRHLPVMEEDQLVGLISIGDVVKQIMSDKETTILGLENYILGRNYSG